jgi:hypothetical protein
LIVQAILGHAADSTPNSAVTGLQDDTGDVPENLRTFFAARAALASDAVAPAPSTECCAADVRQGCCGPQDKAGCCGASAGGAEGMAPSTCGCQAGAGAA